MKSFQTALRHGAKGIFPLVCLTYVVKDVLAEIRYRLGTTETASGATHQTLSVQESVAYIEEVFADYKRCAGVPRFYGRVAEVGPGDNCGVALLFVNEGCDSMDLVDRFYAKRDPSHQACIYREMMHRYPGIASLLEGCELADESSFPRLRRHYGAQASAERFFSSHRGYDFVVSRAVLEHLYDPLIAIEEMARALKAGGMMLHEVDLRDHGMFSSRFHELKFLEVSQRLYRRMTQAGGYPNRLLMGDYKACLERTGLNYELLVTSLVDVGRIEPYAPYETVPRELRQQAVHYVRSVRAGLAAPFDALSDEELSVSGVFISATNSCPAETGPLA